MHLLASLLIPSLVSAAAIERRDNPDNRAAYFLNNNPAGSSIISLKISVDDGTLSSPVVTSTGGKGLYGLAASSTGGAPAPGGADTLFSQDSVVVSQDYLFTVNAGSNTLSLFFINKDDPQHPTLIGSPADTLGEFPQTVAYSPQLKTACVLNGGAKAGVSCFSTDHAKGLKSLGGLRTIALGQTTPPVGPPGTASDLVFNPSQTALIAVVKGDGTNPGYIYAYPVKHDGSISTTPTISRPSELLVDFSISFISDSRAVITDPAYGAALVDISWDFKFTVQTKIVIPGEGATCWSVYSPRFNTIYVIDAGSTNITLVDPASGVKKGTVVLDAANKAGYDSQIDREYLYVLRGTPSVSVLSNDGLNHGVLPKEVQTLDLSAYGPRRGFQGLAIYPSSGL